MALLDLTCTCQVQRLAPVGASSPSVSKAARARTRNLSSNGRATASSPPYPAPFGTAPSKMRGCALSFIHPFMVTSDVIVICLSFHPTFATTPSTSSSIPPQPLAVLYLLMNLPGPTPMRKKCGDGYISDLYPKCF